MWVDLCPAVKGLTVHPVVMQLEDGANIDHGRGLYAPCKPCSIADFLPWFALSMTRKQFDEAAAAADIGSCIFLNMTLFTKRDERCLRIATRLKCGESLGGDFPIALHSRRDDADQYGFESFIANGSGLPENKIEHTGDSGLEYGDYLERMGNYINVVNSLGLWDALEEKALLELVTLYIDIYVTTVMEAGVVQDVRLSGLGLRTFNETSCEEFSGRLILHWLDTCGHWL